MKQSVLFCSAVLLAQAGQAATNIETGSTYLASNLGGSVNAVFAGGTLKLDESKTISRAFTLNDVSTNTIDINGKTVTMSGAYTGAGPITISDLAGGGTLTFTSSSNAYTGITTITSGATFALADSGTIATSSALVNNGVFDISGTTAGATVTSMSGSGSVVLGSQILTISDSNNATFSGVVSGTGSLVLTTGELTLTNVNTLTGTTAVLAGTLTVTQNNGLAASNSVVVNGTLDLSSTTGAVLKSLSGSGVVALGSQNLTLTAANANFTGIIQGSGGLFLTSGTEYLGGENTFTGGVTVSSGATLYIGSASVAYNTVNSGSFGFAGTGAMAMSGIISGTGDVSVLGGGTATISSVQSYTGVTNISNGRLTLTGSGSIASSSGLTVNGIFDIVNTTSGATITSLAGSGYVYLGAHMLTIANGSGDFSGTLSGTGGVVVAGGNQTFSGTSVHTGATTISAGTLTVMPGASLGSSAVVDNAVLDISPSSSTNLATTATIGSLSGSGVVTLGSHTLVLARGAGTFNGTISGTGGLTQTSGTQTLAGANTYTGTTTVGGGTLILANTGSLSSLSKVASYGTFDISQAAGGTIAFGSLSGSGTVVIGTNDLMLNAASEVFSGVIQGDGALIISGGKEILSGTNTYGGGTTINGGTLQIGSNAATGSIVGDVVDNGTLTFTRTDYFVFSGAISGTGAVTQTASGTTVLTAENTYGGGTIISAGALQIGNRGTTGSIAGNVTNNGTLAFARSDTLAFGGVISGRGAVNFLTGTTLLSGASTYTGVTSVRSGAILTLGSGGSIEQSRIVTVDGTFDISAAGTDAHITSLAGGGVVATGSNVLSISNGSSTFSGVISGSGGFTVAGGTQTLSGTNAYSGATAVNGGTLAVTGSIASSAGTTVNAGGRLSGNGSLSSLVVNSGGTVAPGNGSIGTLHVVGTATFASGSAFSISTSSSAISSLSVTGTASLAGALSVSSADGTYLLGQKVAVLTSIGAVNGTFALNPITGNGAHFTSALTYDAHNVYLQIDLASLAPLLPSSATKNAIHVVGAIDAAITAGHTLPAKIEALGNDTSAQLTSDASHLAGEIGAAAPQTGNMLMGPFISAIFEQMHGGPMPAGPGAAPSQAWVTGFGSTNLIVGDPSGLGSHDFRSDVTGLAGGASWLLSRDLMIGAAVSAATGKFHLVDETGKGTANALQAAAYGYVRFSPHFYGSFVAAVSLDQITTKRTLTVSGTDELTGKATAYGFGARYETGVMLNWASPYLALQDQISMAPAYSEKATSGSGSFALRYQARTINSGSVELGFRQSIDTDFTPRWLLTPDGTIHLTDRLAWSHQLLSESNGKAAFAALPSSDFTIYHAKADKDSALVSFGADLEFEGGLRVSAHLDSAIAPNAQSYTAMGGVGYSW